MGFARRIHFPLALDMLLLDSLIMLDITQGNKCKLHGKRVSHASFPDFIDLSCVLSTRVLGVRHTSFTAFTDLL
jgi:Trk K+ transport system NAD-binding subunit